jgi:hypothetical protein
MTPKFVCCQYLKVYNDMAFNSKREYVHTGISGCECMAYQQEIKCKLRGRCIIAREDETWEQVSSKSWKGTKK